MNALHVDYIHVAPWNLSGVLTHSYFFFVVFKVKGGSRDGITILTSQPSEVVNKYNQPS